MLSLFLVLILNIYSSEPARYRITTINCSSSNLSTTKIECRIRSTSRTNQTVSFGATLLKNLTNPLIRYEFSWKTSNNQWREVFKLEKIPFCLFLNRSISLPYLDDLVDGFIKTFPMMPHRCPILTGSYYMQNISNGEYESVRDRVMMFIENFGGMSFKNGIYKHELKIFSVKDQNIYTLTWQVEFNLNGSG